MGMSLECPANVEALLGHHCQQRIDGSGTNLTAGEVEVEHRVDDRRGFGRRVGDEIADRVGRLVEKSGNLRAGAHRRPV